MAMNSTNLDRVVFANMAFFFLVITAIVIRDTKEIAVKVGLFDVNHPNKA